MDQRESNDRLAAGSAGLLLAAALAVAAGCSSGGGGSPSGPTGPVTPPVQPTETAPPYSSFATQPADPANFQQLVSNWETAEYNNQPALGLIKASSAYARGATGAGVTVGVFDSGIHEAHYEFEWNTPSSKVNVIGSDYPLFNVTRTNDRINHGTLVSGVIAARRQNPTDGQFNLHGVAFDAELRVWEIPLGSGGGPYDPVQTTDFTLGDDQFFAHRLQQLGNAASIVNMSFGFSGVITDYSAISVSFALPDTLAALRQSSRSPASRSIFVVSAGNANGDTYANGSPVDASSPEFLAGLPWLFPELRGNMLAVAAVNQNGIITSYSNRCGVAASFCLAAPGGGGGSDLVYGPLAPPAGAQPDTHYYGASAGTSLAAPLVSGSLALLKSLFPTVGNDEIVNRLLQTANRTGIYANSAIYGRGLLDLDAATAPYGALALTTGSTLSDGLSPLPANQIGAGPALPASGLGDALNALEFTAFDALGFPFEVSGSTLVDPAGRGSDPELRHHSSLQVDTGTQLRAGWLAAGYTPGNPDYLSGARRDGANQYVQWRQETGSTRSMLSINGNPAWQFGAYGRGEIEPGFGGRESLFAAPWLSLMQRGIASGLGTGAWQVALFRGDTLSAEWEPVAPVQGALVEYQSRSGNRVQTSWQLGYLDEQGALLGIRGEGLLRGPDSARTLFGGFELAAELPDSWHMLLSGYAGRSQSSTDIGNRLWQDSALLSSSFSAGLLRDDLWRVGDSIELYVHQPLSVESGTLQLQLADGRLTDGSVTYRTHQLDLSSPRRPVETGVRYTRPFGAGAVSATVQWQNSGREAHSGSGTELVLAFRRAL